MEILVYLIITILLVIILLFILYNYDTNIKESFTNTIANTSTNTIANTSTNTIANTSTNTSINTSTIANASTIASTIANTNTESNENIDNDNLIKNGNFENGNNISNLVSQNGYNKIIVKKNPGKTSYVLEQKNTDVLTYYQLECDNDKNAKYNLYFWLSIGKSSIEELDLNKLIQIKFQNEDFSNYIPRLTYNIIQKVVLTDNDEDTWFLVKYDFIAGPNTSNKMSIYLNYGEKLQYNYYYYTNLSLYKVLVDAENFRFNHKLICFTDGYNYQSNIPTWHDLSGNGNDLFWSTIPQVDLTVGSLSTLNQKVVGFSSNKINSENFSILFVLNKIIENEASDNAVNENNSIKDFYLISVPGNNRYSFEIKFQDGYLFINNGQKTYKSRNEVIIYNKSLLAIIYTNDIIHIYLDSINIMSIEIGKLYFSKDSFVINKNKNLNLNLYALLFYNKVINRKELNEIREYFITNKDKHFETPDINRIHMFTGAEYTNNNINYIKPNNVRSLKNESVENIFIDNFDNQNYKEHCLNNCSNICDKLEGQDKANCKNYCKYMMSSCTKYCSDPLNKTDPICNNNEYFVETKNNCPKVFKQNGNYIVYIDPNSEFSKKNNISGEINYGNNRDKARFIYNLNFPQCSIPTELLKDTNNIQTCPFIINELNPCFTSQCTGVNWDMNNYNNMELNKNCKKIISNYCQLNNLVDDKCFCWNPANKNSPECIQMRKFFEDPNDYCSLSQFNIEEHPDFNKYIKKDNIPCWGCDL